MGKALLESYDLPPFSAIKVSEIEDAVREAIDHNRKVIDDVVGSGATSWELLAQPLEDANEVLHRTFSPVSHLNAVKNSPELREVYNRLLPVLSDFATETGQNEALFRAYESLAKSPAWQTFTAAQKASIEHALRDFRLSGVALEGAQKARFKTIAAELSTLTSQFSDNVLDATQAWSRHVVDVNELPGMPPSALEAAQELAREKGVEGYWFTLDFPSYYPVMCYCDNRVLRKEVYLAYTTRASELGPQAGQFDNSAIMQNILALRAEKAALLGFDSYAAYSLASKMAESPQQVVDFLRELSAKSLPVARREYAELAEFAQSKLGIATLEAWDVAWASEKLRHQRFAFTAEELRPYFPVDKVIGGLFAIIEKLFGVHFQQLEGVDVWHPDVRFYDVLLSGKKIAGFYFDLYARENKRGGAWMDDCLSRGTFNGELQLPVAYMTCNFNRPVGGKPALLTHDEVETLFHEFGHGLHHMLTRIDVGSVSGISGVEWDAVELPSQFLENWCWCKEAIPLFSAHHETGEPLPEDLLEKMLAARNFQSAMMMQRQIEFALFDMRIHMLGSERQPANIQAELDAVRDAVAVVKPPAENRFQHSFSHIFAGGYAAGYYSYKWAEVLSADAFSAFEEEGVFNAETGRRFRECILEKGGAQPAAELFAAFRGRAPSIDPLLRHSGIAA